MSSLPFWGYRLLISFFGSVRGSVLGNFIYDIIHPLVVPFYGVFDKMFRLKPAGLTWSTLVAMIIYTLVSVGFAWLTRLFRKSQVEVWFGTAL